MNFQDLVRSRRSVRKFKKESVPDTKLITILDAARWAPSYRNSQPWHFLVLYSKEDLSFVSELYVESYIKLAENLNEDERKSIIGMEKMLRDEISSVSFLIILLADKSKSLSWVIDLSLAAENMMLMAHDLGLGSSFIDLKFSRISKYFRKKDLRESFNIPEEIEIFAMIPFGVPEGETKIPHRRSLSEIVHYGRW
ncbi:MAG: nitroreductase family protein [Thermoplasmata archaeon]